MDLNDLTALNTEPAAPTQGDDGHEPHRRKWRPFTGLRNNFLAGLVVVAPIAITLWMIWSFVGWIDSWVMPFVPGAYHPDALIDRWFGQSEWFKQMFGENVHVNVRGVGVVLFLIFTVIVGWITKGLIGRQFLNWGERFVDRMPVVRSLYNGLKQIAETVFSTSQETKFDKACLVEYPRKGIYAIAFISTKAKGEIDSKIPVTEPIISVFLPTTPNPTSGFLLFVPRHSVIELDMTVEDAAKLVISAGLVYPNAKEAKAGVEAAGAPASSTTPAPAPVSADLPEP